MAEARKDFTIFRLPENPKPDEILRAFGGFPELAAPVAPVKTAAAALYSIPAFQEGELSLLPVFTDPALPSGPCAVRAALPFLQTLFSAAPDTGFSFNPPPPGGRAQGPVIRLDRRLLSAAIGFLQTSGPVPRGAQLEAAIRNETTLGNLHRANYLASVFLSAGPETAPYAPYADILTRLGLLQDAYEHLGSSDAPELMRRKAAIMRLSGNAAKARELLNKAPDDDGKTLELAWLDLEEGKTEPALKAFRRLAAGSFEKNAALFGAGSALMKNAIEAKDAALINAALAEFSAALGSPSWLLPDIFFNMGTLNLYAGRPAETETCYAKAAAMRPDVRIRANLGLALIKNGKADEAAALINEIALVDPESAARVAAELPAGSAAGLLGSSRLYRLSGAAPEQAPPSFLPPQPPASRPGGRAPYHAPTPAPPAEQAAAASLEAAALRSPVTARVPAAAAPASGVPPLKMESLLEASGAMLPSEAEVRKDDFMGRAFDLASAMEEENNRKIYFNSDGLTEVERRLRMIYLNSSGDQQRVMDAVRDSAAFLCFLLQERHKGRLVKMPDFDPWGWPVVFTVPRTVSTYPVQRVWRLLWDENMPAPGWLTRYLAWLEEELKPGAAEKPKGAEAVKAKVPSHSERITDVRTEHRRILLLTSTLRETAEIELSRAGLDKLDKAVRAAFKPGVPPTGDGWKMLRCYGHLLAEMLIKDFKALWYNTDGGDGFWSLQLPWKTFVFPIGKVYKTASNGESLSAYYDALLAEKTRLAAAAPEPGRIP